MRMRRESAGGRVTSWAPYSVGVWLRAVVRGARTSGAALVVRVTAVDQGPARRERGNAAPRACGRTHILCALEPRRGDDETATTMRYTARRGKKEKRGLRPALSPTQTAWEHQLAERLC